VSAGEGAFGGLNALIEAMVISIPVVFVGGRLLAKEVRAPA